MFRATEADATGIRNRHYAAHMRAGVIRSTIAALAAALVLAGCGGPDEAVGVRATLSELARATAARDYTTICEHVFAPALTAQVTQLGLPCELVLSRALGHVVDPMLTVRSVVISGDGAVALVHSAAVGQRPSDDRLSLVKIGKRWYVASLVAP